MILELIQKRLKIDFSSTVIERDGGSSISSDFEIEPRDFLRFAKSDFKTKELKGNVNALTNAKRAIDCQIDYAFSIFGITYDKIPEISQNIINLEDFENSDIAYKLKLIKALDFAPSGLISKARLLRNKLEHYYQKPSKDEISEAIELAELFILSVENRTRIIENNFFLTDNKNYIKDWEYNNFIQFQFDLKKKEFVLIFFENNKEIEKVSLNEKDALFYPMIKLFNNINDEFDFCEALKILLEMIKHPIPKKNIRIEFK
ncbi:hypothetical protein [uncultured Draconibacterium sp.]|uniref:hypothetical protein n=1 Tax=uncultured Draconibacterium sp. TaxID=1573823 RepID=UPI0029C956D4|nr:hypothetical protein [uncultured Draconibacterium sp.]